MFSKSLASFIKEQIKAGHDIGSIRKYLKNYGYQEKDIEESISSTYNEKKPLNKKLIIAAAVIIIILISASFFIFKPKKKVTGPDITLNLEVIDKEAAAGDILRFNLDISSAAAKRYILKIETNVLLKSSALAKSSKSLEFSKRSLTQENIKLPDKIKPGNYILEVKLHYNGKIETAAESFLVKAEEEIIEEEGCPSTCNDNNQCTEDSCGEDTGFKCFNKPIQPCCGNLDCEQGETGQNCELDCKEEEEPPAEPVEEDEYFKGLTIWEKINKVRNLSLINLKEAEDFCNGIELEAHKDQCFVNIAEARQDIKYCDDVINERTVENCYSAIAKLTKDSLICERVSESRRDHCYMPFMMDGDYSVCPKIENKYLQQSCDTLSKVKEQE